MNLFQRYLLYLVDAAVMMAIIGVNVFVFTGKNPMLFDPDQWLDLLLGGGASVWWFTIIGAAGYWTIVDYHPELRKYRMAPVVVEGTTELPPLPTRIGRSFIKSFTLFGGEILLLYALFSKDHVFLHDKITGTERLPRHDPRLNEV